MRKCKLIQDCFFTNDFSNNLPAQLAAIKRTYCNQDFAECARYVTAMKIDFGNVPNNLHPADIEQAELLINSASRQINYIIQIGKKH